jgi:hypothetical protein
MVALLRSYSILKRAGRRGSSGAALSYAAMTMVGNLTFDHNWQALYFMGCGFVLAEVVDVLRGTVPAATGFALPVPPRPEIPSPALGGLAQRADEPASNMT